MSGFIEEINKPFKKLEKEVRRVRRQSWSEAERGVESISPQPPGLKTLTPSPIPKTVMARERAERDKLGKKRRRATVMGGGLGELTLGRPGLLGI